MDRKASDTHFAPAGRADLETLQRQERIIAENSPRLLLDGLPLPVVVVNAQRQIVFCNRRFEEFAHEQENVLPLGRRPGEALGCVHAEQEPDGCGTTRFCRFCGAANAILQSLEGAHSVQLCRLVRRKGEQSCLDFQVFAEPLLCEGQPFVLFSILDIGHELRLESIRNKFLRDVRRRAEAINRMYVSVSREAGGQVKGGLFALGYASRVLMEEIDSQAKLFDAEDGMLGVELESLDAGEALRRAVDRQQHDTANVVLEDGCVGYTLRTDRQLLDYVLGQILENALEAAEGGEVRLSCRDLGARLGLRVGNSAKLTPAEKAQMFQRGFSTKGDGRGFGLYFSRLLARRYLDGDLLLLDDRPGAVFELRLPSG